MPGKLCGSWRVLEVKIIVLNKKSAVYCIVVVALVVALIISLICLVPKAVSAATVPRDLPIYNVDRQDKVVSLTFDAAWGNEDTQKLINILNKHNVKATFFIVGQWADKYPESVKALSDNGMEVMNHSDTHPHMVKLSRDEMLSQINSCDEKVMKITGKKPTLFRAPYGDYNNSVVEAVRASGHYCIQWNVDSLDWKGITADKITSRVMSKAKNGSIILFHNAALHTPEALPGIIESLQKQGYTILPVSQLIYQSDYSIDNAGVQHKNVVSSASGTGSAVSGPTVSKPSASLPTSSKTGSSSAASKNTTPSKNASSVSSTSKAASPASSSAGKR